MAKYHLTKKAVQDLDAIWAYTLNTWSEQKADEYYSALVKTFAEIAKRPCHLDKEYVEIVRILHEKMDIASKFK